MKATLVTNYYPFYGGRVVHELRKHLKRRGVKIRIVSSTLFAEDNEPDVTRLKASQVAFRGTSYTFYGPHNLRKLRCLLEETDIVHLHFTIYPLSLYYGLFEKFRLIRSPVVATPHGLPAGYPSAFIKGVSSMLFSLSKILVLNNASAITAVSMKEYFFLRDQYQKKIVEHIPNGVDTSMFKPDPSQRKKIREKLQVDDDIVLVLYLAGLRSQKGVLIFLDAISEIAKNNPKIAFLVAGGGPLASHVKAFINSQRNHKVHGITKYVPYKYVPDLYNASDIYVLPSYHETMPLSLMEAMACGKSVIATPLGDVPMLVNDGVNGFLVPVNDVQSLVSVIANLAEKPEIRESMGKRNRAKMLGYDWDKIAEKYYRLYQKVLS